MELPVVGWVIEDGGGWEARESVVVVEARLSDVFVLVLPTPIAPALDSMALFCIF